MKALHFSLTLFLFSALVYGQDRVRHFEFGPTLLTVNSVNSNYDFNQQKPRIEYLNGLFFRYTQQRVGFRGFSSYSKYQTTSVGTSSFATLFDGWQGRLDYQDLKIGFGAQYSVCKKCEWLFTFVDLAYTNIFWSGQVIGDTPGDHYSYSATINGFNAYFGLGTRVNVFKVIRISPEFSYSFFRGQEDNNRTSLRTGQTTNNQYNLAGDHPVLKLHLTYLF